MLLVAVLFYTLTIVTSATDTFAVHHHVTYIVSESKRQMLTKRGFIDESQANLQVIGLFDDNNDDYEATDVHAINRIQLILDRMHKQFIKELRRQTTVPGSDKPVHFVAPLMSEDFNRKQNTPDAANIKQWLDKQWAKANQTSSVIYISFGSWAYLQAKQLREIIRALKVYPIIWSLKPNLQGSISSSWINEDKHLLLPWVPQRLVLTHPAIRLFISHGGWNSLLEGMFAGRPTLIWPLFGDQIINGQRLDHELGMGRCLQATDYANGQRLVTSDELRRHVDDIFDQETDYIRKARKVQMMMFNARENSSRIDLEKIIRIAHNQVLSQTNWHVELEKSETVAITKVAHTARAHRSLFHNEFIVRKPQGQVTKYINPTTMNAKWLY
ncbi:unnamed protein product [Adineta ricciae]|uniref:UDP-glucuronosyltransferase n=1 Tax=Adineta ricciae TaxID=249248 RepID=A0A815H4L1_ADIRI|nr:unnamed protein product [Adineta ricciae]